jgi:RNA polymerase sigma factor (sigma-70 family)
MPPPDPEQARWFAAEVLTHERQLKSYLRGTYPSVRDLDDVVQESYLRTWQAKMRHPIVSAKSFLFRIARNLAIDTVRRKKTAATDFSVDFDRLAVLEESAHVAAALGRQEKIDLLIDALSTLPERTREIIFLRKFQNVPQKQVASQLGVSERTVESQLSKGMKRCADYLRKRGVHGFESDE